MSKLFGLNKPNTDLKKNVFDLSEKTTFSISAGLLLPVFTREVNPGEKIQLNVSSFARTQPLNTAAFVRCRQYYHAFFVPYKQLWSGWDNFITGLDYRQSSLQPAPEGGISRVPALDLLKGISESILSGDLSKAFQDDLAKWKMHNYTANRPKGSDTLRPLVAQPASPNPASGVPNIPAAIEIKDELGYEYIFGISRLLDMLGYGIHVPMENGVYSTLSEMISSKALVKDETGRVTSFSNVQSFLNEMKSTTNKLKVNPFRLLAYQKIYNDFYKRDDYERSEPSCFNIDDFDGTKDLDYKTLGANRLYNMLRLRYRWSPKDYFTGIVPSELFGVGNSLSNIRSSNPSHIEAFFENDQVYAAMQGTYGGQDGNGVSVKSIQFALALQKHAMLTRRAGGHDYISQMAAHYGFEPPKGRGDKVEFIDGWSTNINIGEVVTTASTETAVTGQVFGKGIGALDGSKDVSYTAKEHGVIMVITSVVPDTEYSAEGLNAFNAKFERGDYFHPEFADLGLQPVYNYEYRNSWLRSYGGRDVQAAVNNNGIVGLVPRYAEYKTAYDTLHGEFRVGRTFSAWTADASLRVGNGGVISPTLKINPNVLNRITAVAYDGSEATDQFMVDAQLICKVIRPMSITGQRL